MWFKNSNEFQETMGYQLDDGWYPRVTKILEVKNKSGLDSFFKEMESYSAVQEVKNKSPYRAIFVIWILVYGWRWPFILC